MGVVFEANGDDVGIVSNLFRAFSEVYNVAYLDPQGMVYRAARDTFVISFTGSDITLREKTVEVMQTCFSDMNTFQELLNTLDM